MWQSPDHDRPLNEDEAAVDKAREVDVHNNDDDGALSLCCLFLPAGTLWLSRCFSSFRHILQLLAHQKLVDVEKGLDSDGQVDVNTFELSDLPEPASDFESDSKNDISTSSRGGSQSNFDGQGEDSPLPEDVCAAGGNDGTGSRSDLEHRVSAYQEYGRPLNPVAKSLENEHEAEDAMVIPDVGGGIITWPVRDDEVEDEDIPMTDAPDSYTHEERQAADPMLIGLSVNPDDEMDVDTPASDGCGTDSDNGISYAEVGHLGPIPEKNIWADSSFPAIYKGVTDDPDCTWQDGPDCTWQRSGEYRDDPDHRRNGHEGENHAGGSDLDQPGP